MLYKVLGPTLCGATLLVAYDEGPTFAEWRAGQGRASGPRQSVPLFADDHLVSATALSLVQRDIGTL